MDHKEQIQAFDDDLAALIDRYRKEFDLTYAALIGTLVIRTNIIIGESCE